MVQDQKTQSQPQEKEEQFNVSFKGPISSLAQIAGAVGLDQGGESQPTETMSPDEFLGRGGGGSAEHEELFANAHPDDVAAIEQRMGQRPRGVQIPESAYKMPPGRPPQPAGQAGIPKFTGGSGGLPSQREAFEYSMQAPPPIQTKQEFEAGQESPSWWRIMMADFAGGAPGAGREELNARMDKAYQESIQKQMQDRSEFERKQGIVEKFATNLRDVGKMIGMEAGEFMVPESQMGSYAGMMGKYRDANNQKTVNFSTMKNAQGELLMPGAPDVDFPPAIAKSMIPLITNMMKEGKVTSWPQFVKEYPEEAKEWERFKSGLKKDEAAVVKQKFPDDLSEKRALIRDPRQMNEYLTRIGEDVTMQIGNAYMEGQTITAVDSDGEVVDIGPIADNYLWQIRKRDPAYRDWAKEYLREEGLAFRTPPSRDATRSYIEGLMRSEGVITEKQKPTTRSINKYANEYMAANEITEEEFKAQSKKAIGRGEFKRYKGGYRSINNQMRRDRIPVLEIDKFLGYHFPEEHSKNMLRRGKGEDYVGAMTEKILKDVTPGGGVIQGFGTKVDRSDLEDYAEAKGITFEEALEEARQNPDIRLVGIE